MQKAKKWYQNRCNIQLCDLHFETKILDQLSKRGWTKDKVISTVNNPVRKVNTVDKKYLSDGSGLRRSDPATAHFISQNQYVVINNIDNTIVQVSNLLDSAWKSPF